MNIKFSKQFYGAQRYIWLGLLLTVLLTLSEGGRMAQAAEKTLLWQRYDVNLAVQPNSDILVEEIQEIAFTSGTFTFGFAAIPLGRVERIADIQLSELIDGSERPYTPNSTGDYGFTAGQNNGDLEITWYFPPTRNSAHTYILRYRVSGGLRIYPEGDQLWWKAIPPDHNFPIRSATVTVTLPQTFPKDQLVVGSYGAPTGEPAYTDRGQVVFQAQNISADQELEVRVQFPHGVVQGQPPAWQASDDRQRTLGPVMGVIFGALGLLTLIGGPLGVYLLWYKRGRDLPVGPLPEYITEPPSDLPAGIVGTLVDENADLKDIIATITDLARRGVLRMEEQQTEGVLGIGSGREYVFRLVASSQAQRPYEQTLLKGLFDGQNERRMSDLRERFYAYLPTLRQQLYNEVVQLDFFPSNPSSTRTLWRSLGVVGVILGGVISFGLLAVLGDFSSLAVCPGVGLVITGLALLFTGPHLPRKTLQGAEEAAKWLAFKRYLQTIEKHGDLAAVKDKFEQFLPYAIAFGLERSLIHKFSSIDTPAPHWWGPMCPYGGYYGYPHHGGMSSGGQTAGGPADPPGPLAGSEGGIPSLSDMNRGLGLSLAGMSSSLGAMLSSASSTLTSTPAPKTSHSGGGWSGGGWSGGGSFGGGGGGGGSRGFG
ncbi:MAG: DUF2207 domain-containing protein [Anaerolineae bacterium]